MEFISKIYNKIRKNLFIVSVCVILTSMGILSLNSYDKYQIRNYNLEFTQKIGTINDEVLEKKNLIQSLKDIENLYQEKINDKSFNLKNLILCRYFHSNLIENQKSLLDIVKLRCLYYLENDKNLDLTKNIKFRKEIFDRPMQIEYLSSSKSFELFSLAKEFLLIKNVEFLSELGHNNKILNFAMDHKMQKIHKFFYLLYSMSLESDTDLALIFAHRNIYLETILKIVILRMLV